MKLWLHHINLCSTDVPAMDEFYRSVLDLAPEPSLRARRDMSQVCPAFGAAGTELRQRTARTC